MVFIANGKTVYINAVFFNARKKGDDNMSKVLERCKRILAIQRKSDNESIGKLIRETARELKVNATETQIERAIVYLKYGCVIW